MTALDRREAGRLEGGLGSIEGSKKVAGGSNPIHRKKKSWIRGGTLFQNAALEETLFPGTYKAYKALEAGK